jgi:hypothetical protein
VPLEGFVIFWPDWVPYLTSHRKGFNSPSSKKTMIELLKYLRPLWPFMESYRPFEVTALDFTFLVVGHPVLWGFRSGRRLTSTLRNFPVIFNQHFFSAFLTTRVHNYLLILIILFNLFLSLISLDSL